MVADRCKAESLGDDLDCLSSDTSSSRHCSISRRHASSLRFLAWSSSAPSASTFSRASSRRRAWSASCRKPPAPVRSFLGYHCNREEYRPFCKKAFALWGEALRVTQLQLRQKELRALQKAAPAAQQGGKKKKKKKATYA